jgi:hypothetical protein
MSGRPLKTTVEFFTHDCKHGKTIFVLEQQYGNDGYSFWYKLLELLGDTPGHAYDFNNPESWQYLLAYTKVSDDKAKQILATLISLKKIDSELLHEKIIWCQNFVNRLSDVYEKRQTPLPIKPKLDSPPLFTNINSISDAVIPINPSISSDNSISDSDNTHSIVKDSIVKDSILSVFEFWNEQKIIVHKNCNGSELIIKKLLKTYTADEIKQAIKNYTEILHSDNYYWTYIWTLEDFLKRGFDKFYDLDVAKKNYAKSSKNKKIEEVKGRAGW